MKKTKLDKFTAVGICEGFIPCDDEQKIIDCWQYLHDTRIAYALQGYFGRTCQQLISNGIINA